MSLEYLGSIYAISVTIQAKEITASDLARLMLISLKFVGMDDLPSGADHTK